jgi:hypothetical protein
MNYSGRIARRNSPASLAAQLAWASFRRSETNQPREGTVRMKTHSISRSRFFRQRVISGFVLCLIGLLLGLAALSNPVTRTARPEPALQSDAAMLPSQSAYPKSTLSHKVIDATNGTYAYDLFDDGRLIIHQTSVPALPGNEGFKSAADAAKVADAVIKKINSGEMPPTISVEELRRLNVIR